MAAAVLHNKVKAIEKPEITVDSAGTSNWHVGQGPTHHQRKSGNALDINMIILHHNSIIHDY
jgi:protein-tyrosine-phosphatase